MEYEEIVESAKEVHSVLGPNFTENIYHRSLERELSERGVPFSSEGTLSVKYKGVPVGRRRPDLFVTTDDGLVIVELKAGSNSGDAQLAQYLDLVDQDTGFGSLQGGVLLQFNEELEYSVEEYDENKTDL